MVALFLYINNSMTKLIILKDLQEAKQRKEQELEFYNKQLEELNRKMFWLGKEIELTNTIINMIEEEKVTDLLELTNGDNGQ